VNGELADDGLTRTRGRGDQNTLTGLKCSTGLDLKVVEFKFIKLAELM
jgi:hypothetical protein